MSNQAALLIAARSVAAECRHLGEPTRDSLASLCIAVDGCESVDPREPVWLNLWRGDCGHHWIRSEVDACPICKIKTIAAAHYCDSEALLGHELEDVERMLACETQK